MVTREDLVEKAKRGAKGLRKRIAPKDGELSDDAVEARQERAARLRSMLMASPPVEDATLEPADVDRMDTFAGGYSREHGRMLDFAMDRDTPPKNSLESLAMGTGPRGGRDSMEDLLTMDLDFDDHGSSHTGDPLKFDVEDWV